MSEAPHDAPHDELATVIPLRRENESHVDFSKLPAEEVIDEFITMYSHHPALKQRRGSALAELINHDLTDATNEPDSLGLRLNQLEQEVSSAWRFAEVYDHKDEHDPVFHRLADLLQSTKQIHDIQLQRKVARKLLNLRATLHDDATDYDEEWLSLSDRLFS